MLRQLPFGFLIGCVAVGQAQVFRFRIDPVQSHFIGSVTGNVKLDGSFVGNYDAATNPNGTRTKPGLIGNWAPNENTPVPVSGVATVASSANTPISGGFIVAVDLANMKIKMAGYNATLFASTPASVVAALTPSATTFRTQNPSFAYVAATETIPIGPLSIKNLKVAQTSTLGQGPLKLRALNTYSFVIGYNANVTATVSTGAQTKTLTKTVPMLFAGTLVIDGAKAKVLAHFVEGGSTLNLPTPVDLPAIHFSLPTLTKPANLIANLTLESASVKPDHSATLIAVSE